MLDQEAATTAGAACVRFRLGTQGFALPLWQVREIATAGRITPVPLAPAVVRGLANLRGRVITLIDVAVVFDRPLPQARFLADRLALVLSAPYDHLGVYVHAPVEIGQAMTRAGGKTSGPSLVMTAGGVSRVAADEHPVET